MVVWVFAGGGATEVKGLIPFLQAHFAGTFERKMPVSRKPGPKPRRDPPTQGYTGKGFLAQLKKQLHAALSRQERCDLIVVLDDLDCRPADEQRLVIEAVLNEIAETAILPQVIGFAAPEIEAWLLADWKQIVQPDAKLKQTVGWPSSHKHIFPFNNPETFSYYDSTKDSCHQKLSAEIERLMLLENIYYSKAEDTPRLWLRINPLIVSQKCPLFRAFFDALSDHLPRL